jgi:hypothetical protein
MKAALGLRVVFLAVGIDRAPQWQKWLMKDSRFRETAYILTDLAPAWQIKPAWLIKMKRGPGDAVRAPAIQRRRRTRRSPVGTIRRRLDRTIVAERCSDVPPSVRF